jgi:hypothetical protein
MSRAPLRDPVEEFERRAHLRQLVADMRELPEQQRSALLMRELEGLSYNELADALDVTIPAIKSLLVRARIGLVESVEAREAACTDIRDDLSLAHRRGVRVSGRSRRHMRECRDCRDYRKALKSLEKGLAALNPSGPFAGLLNLIGLGGSGAAAIGGGATLAAGGGAAAVGTKVVAVVCAAAVVTGTAHEVREVTKDRPKSAPAPTMKRVTPERVAPVVVSKPAHLKVTEAKEKVAPPVVTEPAPETAQEATERIGQQAGGIAAPAGSEVEPEVTPTPETTTPAEPPAVTAGSTP